MGPGVLRAGCGEGLVLSLGGGGRGETSPLWLGQVERKGDSGRRNRVAEGTEASLTFTSWWPSKELPDSHPDRAGLYIPATQARGEACGPRSPGPGPSLGSLLF